MAIKLSANYSKKLGLPAYSSHSFSASVEIELTDLTQVEAECAKLYALLQHSVDREIQQVGFVPDPAQYGHQRNGYSGPHGAGHHGNGSNGHRSNLPRNGNGDRWNCTDGQRGFILRIIGENNLDKQETENLAVQLFGVGVKQLNKMQASQLIEELLAKAGKPRPARWQQQSQPQPDGSP
jgi:hypothetical protein